MNVRTPSSRAHFTECYWTLHDGLGAYEIVFKLVLLMWKDEAVFDISSN
jgi:hypothetical protein